MVDINTACEMVIKGSPLERVETATDIGHSFVLGMAGINGEQIDRPPFMVNKQTGNISVCFPPLHWDELKKGKLIEIPVKYQPTKM